MTRPYKYLAFVKLSTGDVLIEGDRDALVEMKSVINQALREERGEDIFADSQDNEQRVVVRRLGA